MMSSIDRYDPLEVYCPQLGMLLTFSYCRRAQGTLPCRNLIGCWMERVPVEDFLKEHFSPDILKALLMTLPKTRLERILEGIDRLRANQPSEKDR